jgi:hypothetical protein
MMNGEQYVKKRPSGQRVSRSMSQQLPFDLNGISAVRSQLVQAEVHCDPLQQLRGSHKNNDDARSSSGNWSASNATSSENSAPTTEGGSCASLLSAQLKHSAADSCDISTPSDFKCAAEKRTLMSDCQSNRSFVNDDLLIRRQRTSSIQFANRDSESWLQYFERVDSNDTLTNLDDSSLRSDSSKLKRNPSSASKHGTVSLEADELLSIYSEDTDGYYTSMHTDSGLYRGPGNLTLTDEPAEELMGANKHSTPSSMNSFVDRSEQRCDSNRTSKNESHVVLNRERRPKAIPPIRSCSALSSQVTNHSKFGDIDCGSSLVSQFSSISNQTSNPSEQQCSTNNSLGSCSTLTSNNAKNRHEPYYANESESESVIHEFRMKTSIDAGHYPSMVAVSDCEHRSESVCSVGTFSDAGTDLCEQTGLPYMHQTSRSLMSSMNSCKSSTLGSYASLTRLKELLKPLRRFGSSKHDTDRKKSSLNGAHEPVDKKNIDSKRKESFVRFPSLYRSKSTRTDSRKNKKEEMRTSESYKQQLLKESDKLSQTDRCFDTGIGVHRMNFVGDTHQISGLHTTDAYESNVARMVNQFESSCGFVDNQAKSINSFSLNMPFSSCVTQPSSQDIHSSSLNGSFAKLFPVGRTSKVVPAPENPPQTFGQLSAFENHYNQVSFFFFSFFFYKKINITF